jgi:PAS domain S-box-containing protein
VSVEHLPAQPASPAGQADFLSLAESLSSLIALIRDGNLVYVNPAGCAILGRPREFLLGRRFCEFVHPEERGAAIARAQARADGPEPPGRVVERLVREDGTVVWMECSLDQIRFEGRPATLVTGHDVTERVRAEEQLRKSEANLAESQRIAQVGGWEWDMTTDRVTWSDELFRMYGLDPAKVEASYELFVARLHPEDRDKLVATGEKSCGDGTPFECELRLIRTDGEVRTVWTSGRVDVDEQGKPLRIYGAVQDITDRRRAQEALARSEARLAEAQRIGHIGSWEWDIPANRVCWSDELCRLFGIDPRAFGGTLEGYLEMVHPDDRDMTEAAVERALRRGGPFAFEHRVVRWGDDVRIIFGRGEVFVDAAGKPVRVAGTAQDITEQRRMEEELGKSQERFHSAFMGAAIGKAIVSLDRKILQINPAACATLGYTVAELVGRSIEDITHPEDREKTRQFVSQLVSGGDPSGTYETRFQHRDGHVVWSLVTSTVVRDAAGKPLYLIAEAQDITDRRRAEAELRQSEERFRNLCTQAPVMLMSFDPQGRVREVSHYWLQTMGYERDEIVGKDAWRLITPESRDRLRDAIEANQRNRQFVIRNLPLRNIRKDGTTVDILSTSVAEMGDDGERKGAICVQIDLTDLQRAEAALRESEERYRALVEHAPDAIMVLDVDTGRFVDANAHAQQLFGHSREKLLTMGPLDFCSERQADGRRSCEVVENEHRKVLEGAISTFEFTHIDASGREIACQTRLTRLPAAGRRLIRCTITDISELKQLQEKVRHADRLAAAGILAAGVAHEIGNPLMALSMAAQSLERRNCDDYARTKLTLIREHIDRISRIVRQMSDLARPHTGKRVSCDVNQIVRRAVDMVRYDRRSKGSEIRYELAEHVPPVDAIEDELSQVCINLALNAFDAMAANPPDRPRRLAIGSSALKSGVRVWFRDTGPGVAPEARAKLFQPFFTTKEAGRGSGLGLSVSYRILQEHEGSLRLEEDAGPGACFVFELPHGREP